MANENGNGVGDVALNHMVRGGGIDIPTGPTNRLKKIAIGAVNPWDRTDAESTQAWEAFRYFRDMGSARTLVAVWKDFELNEDTVARWSARHTWRMRATAWDIHLDQIAQKEFEAEAETMGRRQAKIGMSLQSVGGARIAQFAENEQLRESLTARDAVAIIQAGVNIERDARASSKGNTNTGGGGKVVFNLNFGKMPKWAPKGITTEGTGDEKVVTLEMTDGESVNGGEDEDH